MSLFLSKLLPIFIYPLGIALLLGLAALAVSFTRCRWLSRVLLAVGLVVLWVGSTPVFAGWLSARLEAAHPPAAIATLPAADVAIVLGGAVGLPLPPRITADLGPGVDRVVHAARLFRAGKVGHILVTAGNQPWLPEGPSEAELIREFLGELGVPDAAIVLDTESRNTHENAVNATAIVGASGWRTVLLVTSGAHMPRALAAFRKAGVDATPAATDIQATFPLYNSPLDLMPDAGALAATAAAIKEWLGLTVYRLRGWA